MERCQGLPREGIGEVVNRSEYNEMRSVKCCVVTSNLLLLLQTKAVLMPFANAPDAAFFTRGWFKAAVCIHHSSIRQSVAGKLQRMPGEKVVEEPGLNEVLTLEQCEISLINSSRHCLELACHVPRPEGEAYEESTSVDTAAS